MTPDEVIVELKRKEIDSSRATLLRYENANLIPDPVRGSGGRGHGKFTDYSAETVAEYAASYHLIKNRRATQEQAATARQAVYKLFQVIAANDSYPWGRLDDTIQSLTNGKRKIRTEKRLEDYPALTSDNPAEFEVYGCFITVLATPFSVEWWEVRQISHGQVDPDYLEFCKRVDWADNAHFQGDSIRFRNAVRHSNEELFKAQEVLAKVQKGLALLSSMYQETEVDEWDHLNFERIGRWVALARAYPEQRAHIRTAMLANYRDIPAAAFDFLIDGRVPDA